MEVVSGDNWSYKSCKAPVKSSPPTILFSVLFSRLHQQLRSVTAPWIGFTCYGAIEIIVVLLLLLLTNQHPVFYRPDALPVAQPTVSKHWRENITFRGLAYPKLTWGLPLCLWPLIAPGYLGEGCHASHQPSDASSPLGKIQNSKRTSTRAIKQLCNKLLITSYL